MTLADLIPSLRRSLYPQLAGTIWPRDATVAAGGELTIGGTPMSRVAAMFGTPCYVIDEADIRHRCRQYRAALPEMEIAYASKALLTRAVAHWMDEEGLSLDVCSAGELAIARSVGFPAERIIVHGNAKTPEDLKAVLGYRVGRIVIDTFDEIDQLASLASDRQRALVRVTPGIDGHTHRAIAPGVDDQKFGFSLANGAAAEAVRRILATPNLHLVGLHCHIGSQISRVASFEQAARRMIALMATIAEEHGLQVPQLNLGGGHAVPYEADEAESTCSGSPNASASLYTTSASATISTCRI
jgi:diaminopimelate decarboxylase